MCSLHIQVKSCGQGELLISNASCLGLASRSKVTHGAALSILTCPRTSTTNIWFCLLIRRPPSEAMIAYQDARQVSLICLPWTNYRPVFPLAVGREKQRALEWRHMEWSQKWLVACLQSLVKFRYLTVNTLRPRQNCRRFANYIFKWMKMYDFR